MSSMCRPTLFGTIGGDSPFLPHSGYATGTQAPRGNIECNANAVKDYFGPTCAASLGDMFLCWQPAGQCEATVNSTGYDVTFANGAVLEHTSAGGTDVDAVYVSPNGDECGTFTTEGDPAGSGYSIIFTPKDGEDYEMRVTAGSTSYDIICPNGEKVSLDGAQEEMLRQCTGGDAVVTCAAPSLGDFDYDDFEAGDFCSSNSDCPSGAGFSLVCCEAFGSKICQPSQVCNALR